MPSSARSLETMMWLGGAICAVLFLGAVSRSFVARHAAAEIIDSSRSKSGDTPPDQSSAGPSAGSFALTAPNSRSHPDVVGRVEIPAIRLITPLLAGDDSMSLSEGAGHIPGTALPGGLGTVGIAGHRDTHFRSLSRAMPGMEVLLKDRTGTYHYRVTSTEIVTPEQVSVLDIGSTPELVLITCYPFRYIGAAPKRFVVHASLLSAAADELK